MSTRLLSILSLFMSFSAFAQLSVTTSVQGTQCNNTNDGSITLNPIEACYTPLQILANNDTFNIHHLEHQGFDSVLHVNGTDSTVILDIWSGSNGANDVYVVGGFFDDTVTMGGGQINPTVNNAQNQDGFIACFDQTTHALLWSVVIGDSATSTAWEINSVSGVTSDGAFVYATALINNPTTIGSTLYNNGPLKLESVVLKVDLLTGVIDTSMKINSSNLGVNYPTGIDAKNGMVYITGGYAVDAITLAGTSYPASVPGFSAEEDVFVLALDADSLTEAWGNVTTGAGNEYARKIKANDAGGTTDRIFISANFESNAQVGSSSFTSNGNDDFIIAALDSSGNWLWANAFGSSTNLDNSFALEVNNAGDQCYISGRFGGSMTIGANTYNANGAGDGYIAGFDSAGNHTSFYAFGGALEDLGVTALEMVEDDYLMFAGSFTGSIFYGDSSLIAQGQSDAIIGKLKMDSTEVYGVHFLESTNSDAQFNALSLHNGRVFGAGYFAGDATATQTGLLASGGLDGMVTDMSIMASSSLLIDSLMGGSYGITITNGIGNTYNDSLTVSSPAPINVNAVIGGATSGISTDGFIDLIVSGGTPGYDFNWSNGDSTQNIDSLSFGAYLLTITDTNGCVHTDSFYVDSSFIAPPMLITASITDALCFGDTNGSIDLTVQYGIAPYTFLWSTADTTEDVMNLGAGSYIVTITDDSLNVVIDTFIVGSNPPILINGTVTNTSFAGAGDGAIDVTSSGGTGPYTFLWSNAEMTEDIDTLAEGNYTITVTDALGCTDTASFFVDSTASAGLPFVVSDSITHETCYGDSNGMIDLTVTGGTAPYQYNWNTGDTVQDLTNIPQGMYSVTVTDSDTSMFIDTFMVSGNPEIIVTGMITPPTGGLTNDGAIDLSVSGGTPGYSYIWSNGSSSEDIDSLGIGSFVVTVTDSAGCSVVRTFAVDTIPALNLFSISGDVTCLNTQNGFIDLTVVGGVYPFTFSWSNGATTEDVSGLASGNYSVTVVDSVGQSQILTDSIGSNPQFPDPVAGPITGSPSVQSWNNYTYSVPASNGSSFDWSINGGSINTTASNAASVLWNAGPDGKLWVTETDANGCIGKDSIAVTIIFLGINETHENTVRVYPNPNNGSFNVELPEAFSSAYLSILSLSGQMIHSQQLNSLESFIALDKLSTGTYLLSLEQRGTKLTTPLIIQ